ncbi:hypothetical protein M3Y94_00759300 [Aphelenchoides besseyi]|nr:hypothetical protein M3Y94_00759300 [Aphelenchoides besseyi]
MRLRGLVGFVVFVSEITIVRSWSEADESRRISQIKAEENRVFEMQMGGKNPFGRSPSMYSEERESWSRHGRREHYDPMTQAYQNGHYSDYPTRSIYPPSSPVHRVPIESRLDATYAAKLKSSPQQSDIAILEKRTKNWCFHCASPWHSIGADNQQAIRNLLEIRRARFPSSEFIRSDCSSPKNVSSLPKQDCAHSYCQSLVLTDHDSATSLTIRGCAERLGAIEEREMEKRGDNTCKKLHPTVDIQECICKNRKFCYAGSKRNFGYEENEEATFYRRLSSASNRVLNGHSILIAIFAIVFIKP